jgi:hypothetical protein
MKNYIDIIANSNKRKDGPNSSSKGISSSANFKIELPNQIKGIKGIKLIGGVIPNFTTIGLAYQRYLYLDIPELDNKKVTSNGLNCDMFAKLNYDFDTLTTSPFIRIKNDKYMATLDGGKKILTFKVYDQYGLDYKFGNDILSVSSFTAASPTVVTTSTAHGLVNGDVVYFNGFKNGSSIGIDNTINSMPYVITTSGPNSFTIPLDLSGEVSPAADTGISAYALGANAIVSIAHNQSMSYKATFSTTNPTTITTSAPHGITASTARIRISGFDNGSTSVVNNVINQYWEATITGPSTITIPYNLSGESALQQKTGTLSPYTLGLGSICVIDKMQTSFDLRVYY